jgi:hypothetical protein
VNHRSVDPAPPRKTNPLVWIVVGVLGLFLMAVIAMVAGGIFIAKKAGDMAANSKVSMEADMNAKALVLKGPDGTVRFGDSATLPDWLPVYPRAKAQSAGTQTSDSQESGMVMITTSDSPQKVIHFYQAAFKTAGITDAQNSSATLGGVVTAVVAGKSADGKRSARITATDGNTKVGITYAGKT